MKGDSVMRCRFCGKKISSSDPTYHDGFHYECNIKLLEEIEKLKIAKILSLQGTKVMYQFDNSFFDALNKELEDAETHILHDSTVDDDFVTLFGVLRAVNDYLPKTTPRNKVLLCCEMVFNTLMSQYYGSPLVPCKKFGHRIEEFVKEVYSFPIKEEMVNELKQFNKIKWTF